VHDGVFLGLELEVRNIQLPDRVKGTRKGAFTPGAGARRAQLALHLAEHAQDPRAVEALTFTVFAEAHLSILLRAGGAGTGPQPGPLPGTAGW
jgi:hypothetical protein